MKPEDGWNPIGGKEHYTAKRNGRDSETEKKVAAGRVVFWVFALAIIGITIGSPVVRDMAKSLIMAIWDMLCDIGNAFGDFIEYIQHQRSG